MDLVLDVVGLLNMLFLSVIGLVLLQGCLFALLERAVDLNCWGCGLAFTNWIEAC